MSEAVKKTVKKTTAKKVAPKKAASKTTKVTTKKDPVEKRLQSVVKKLDDAKAENILVLDLKGKTSLADYMVIASGTSTRHVAGVANRLIGDLKKEGVRVRTDGAKGEGNWIVVDLADILVHLFTNDTRTEYNLEEFWSDKK